MDNTDFYSRLLAGESMDDIANEMADALTAAQKLYDAEMERRAAEEAKRAAAEAEAAAALAKVELAQAAKVNDLSALLLDTLKYLRTHYPDLVNKEIDDDYSVEDLARLFVALLDSSSPAAVDWCFGAFPSWKWLF